MSFPFHVIFHIFILSCLISCLLVFLIFKILFLFLYSEWKSCNSTHFAVFSGAITIQLKYLTISKSRASETSHDFRMKDCVIWSAFPMWFDWFCKAFLKLSVGLYWLPYSRMLFDHKQNEINKKKCFKTKYSCDIETWNYEKTKTN